MILRSFLTRFIWGLRAAAFLSVLQEQPSEIRAPAFETSSNVNGL